MLCRRAPLANMMKRSFKISYDTSIPRSVGLSGSSAIVTATFRALMKFHKVDPVDLFIEKAVFPQIILDVEQNELGISAGLQDRVVQVYGGLTYMDFSALKATGKGFYQNIDPSVLPPLYLAFNERVAGESGKVHSSVRQRYKDGDKEIIDGMHELGLLTDKALQILVSHDDGLVAYTSDNDKDKDKINDKDKDYEEFSCLIQRNFQLRRQMYGDSCVGVRNIELFEVALELGIVAKFTGSGGCFVCMRKSQQDTSSWELSKEEFDHVHNKFKELGYTFEKLRPSMPLEINTDKLIYL